MSKCVHRFVVGCVAVASIAAGVLWLWSVRERYWERTLRGPFSGEEFNGVLSVEPTSSLQIGDTNVISVYWQSGIAVPILALRDSRSNVLWARLLVPRNGSGEISGTINTLKLIDSKITEHGHKVRLSCDWTGGGVEEGLIYLDERFQFHGFALGW